MSESTQPQRSDVRASDAERERVVTALRDHAAQGRLDAEELEERIGRVYAARTRGDLNALTSDLPAPRPRPRPRRRKASCDVRAFVLVNLMLIAIWAASGFGYFWPIWPLMGWGVGIVAAHGGRRVVGRW